jgi:hypothetical protein
MPPQPSEPYYLLFYWSKTLDYWSKQMSFVTAAVRRKHNWMTTPLNLFEPQGCILQHHKTKREAEQCKTYEPSANDSGSDYTFPMLFTIGKGQTLGGHVRVDHPAPPTLFVKIESGDDAHIPQEAKDMTKTQRWTWFVSLAVERYENHCSWGTSALVGEATSGLAT